jgi:hypothetical protein
MIGRQTSAVNGSIARVVDQAASRTVRVSTCTEMNAATAFEHTLAQDDAAGRRFSRIRAKLGNANDPNQGQTGAPTARSSG